MLYFEKQLLKSFSGTLSTGMLIKRIWTSSRNGPVPGVNQPLFQYSLWGEGIESPLEEDWRRTWMSW